MDAPLKGLVLAGGKSVRLGRDKVVLDLDGAPLLARAVRLLRQVCADVHVSGRDPACAGLDAPWLPDDAPGQGPLGGIATGLARLGGPLLVLACDLPLMDRPTLELLLAARAERPAGTAMTTFRHPDSDWIEALVAVYEDQALDLLLRAADAGVHSLRLAVPETSRHHVPFPTHTGSRFLNINRPEDLEELVACVGPEPLARLSLTRPTGTDEEYPGMTSRLLGLVQDRAQETYMSRLSYKA